MQTLIGIATSGRIAHDRKKLEELGNQSKFKAAFDHFMAGRNGITKDWRNRIHS
jgi:hypothetical protein